MQNRPTLERDGITYVWKTNARDKFTYETPEGVEVFNETAAPVFYQGAVLGRPAGREDYTPEEIAKIDEELERDFNPSTIAQNEVYSSGVYVRTEPAVS